MMMLMMMMMMLMMMMMMDMKWLMIHGIEKYDDLITYESLVHYQLSPYDFVNGVVFWGTSSLDTC